MPSHSLPSGGKPSPFHHLQQLTVYTQEQYNQLTADYTLSWTDEQLQTRKEEIIHLINQVHEYLPDIVEAKRQCHNGITYSRNPAYALLNCQYHDIDEEQDTRAYYAANPSPTREAFNAHNA